MAAINIYVPSDLKALMDQRPDMPWSALANEAFRKQLNLIGETKNRTELETQYDVGGHRITVGGKTKITGVHNGWEVQTLLLGYLLRWPGRFRLGPNAKQSIDNFLKSTSRLSEIAD